jgi:hypothetical protein
MNEDPVPSKKRSFEISSPAASTKFAWTSASLTRAHRDASLSSSSSHILVDVQSTGPSLPFTSLAIRDKHPLMLHLDLLKLSIHKGETEIALRRVEEVRRLCHELTRGA